MRRTALACLGFTTLAFAPVLLGSTQVGCSNQPQGEHVIRSAQPIQGGTVDQSDGNIVGILIGQNGQLSSLCSGSLIGPNLVLTAHHCVANPPNNLVCGGKFSTTITGAANFMVTTSYNAAYNLWVGTNPTMPTANGVTWWGVSTINVPTTNNVCAGDQALLTLSSSISGVCPLIPAVDVQPTDSSSYTAVGFGITSPNGQNAGERYKVTGMTVQCVGSTDCQDTTIAATGEWEGGSTSNKGTCEGDSGGPALDASNRILGTVSRGPSNACNSTVYESTYDSGGATNGAWIKTIAKQAATAGGYTVAGWVTGGATSDPTNGYPCGTSSSSSSSSSGTTSSSSSSSSSSGATGGVPTTCTQADGTVGCCDGNVNYYCSATSHLHSTDCSTSGLVCGWDATNGYYGCVSPPATSDPSGTHPLACGGGTTSSSSSSSSGTTTSSSSSGTTSSSSSSSSSSGCVPATSCPSGQNCGSYPDGCGGLVTCGTCPTGQTCGAGGTPNVCGGGTTSSSSSSSSGTTSSSSSSSSGCVPLATCPSGLTCGTYDNGCGGMLFCGTCASGQTCSNNVCGTGSSSSSSSSSSGGSGDAGAGDSGGSSTGDAGTGGTGGSGTGGTGGGSGSSSSSSGFSTGGSSTSGSGRSDTGGSVSGSSGTYHAPGNGQNGGCSCEAAGAQEGTSHLSFSAFGVLALAGMVRARKRRSA